MNSIRVLPEDIATKIAAGEVIERPASVVRELLDNCVDAGADKISIAIEEGGKKYIKVSDNGIGMDKDDILLSLERHATSKIKSISDLFSVNTLGFRGEALPSIASVSKMEISSRPSDQMEGYRLKVVGGKLLSMDEIGAPMGTTVQVRDLFYNTPARRKFLRALRTETDHIIDTASRIILPFNQIQLRMDSNGRTILNLPASGNEANRLSALLGRDVAGSLVDAFYDDDAISVKAYLAPPDLSRNRNDRLFVYINNRSIKDRLITRAVMEGYGQRLMRGRYPQVVLFLTLDPSLVDVNVHPTKQEVRFQRSQLVFKTLTEFISATLKKEFSSFHVSTYSETESFHLGSSNNAGVAEPEWEYTEVFSPGQATKETVTPEECFDKGGLRIIGQLKDTYILCEADDGLLVLDQHAAHERIVYETLKKSYKSSKIESQTFLIPQRIELSQGDASVIMEKLGQLSALGLEVEDFGGNTFILRSVPSMLVDLRWDQFLLDLIPILREEEELSKDKAMDRLLTTMACHSAIRAGKKMSLLEMDRLVEQLEKMDLPTNCPHGRPIFRRFNFNEIEKMFKRIV